MAKCKTYTYGGLGACKALRDSIKGVIIADLDTTISAANAAIIGAAGTSGWTTILSPPIATSTYEKGVLIDISRGYEVTSPDPEMTTTNVGFVEQTGDEAPSMTAYGKMSYPEYKSYFDAHGKEFEITLVAKNGNVIGTKTSAGTLKGFRGRFFVKKGAIPKTGADLQQECRFMFVFDDPEEWENIYEIETEFTYTELVAAVPVGLDVTITTDYEGTGGTMTVKSVLRNTNTPYAGLTATTNWQILESINDTTCAVTNVDDTNAAQGVYVLTLTASLNGPVKFRATKEGTVRTYVSAPVYFEI